MFGFTQPQQQQRLVAAICQRMNRLGQQGSRPGHKRGNGLDHGNGPIGRQGIENPLLRICSRHQRTFINRPEVQPSINYSQQVAAQLGRPTASHGPAGLG